MNSTNQLSEYLSQVLQNPLNAKLDLDKIAQEDRAFADNMQVFCNEVSEIYRFTLDLSDGELEKNFDGKNPFIGALKELQSGLRHFAWQIKQVANGDKIHKASFMGDFSASFNDMTMQLYERRELLVQNHNLELELEENRRKALEEQLTQQLVYHNNVTQMQKNISSFKHDIGNHILCLYSLIENNENQKAKEYIRSMSINIKEGENIINTGNPVFDALLTQKILLIQGKGIVIERKIHIKKNIQIDPMDWSKLIGNAWDNAVEACQELEPTQEKKIVVHIKSYKNVLNIAIKNTAKPPQLDEEGNLITSKKDSLNHGIGIGNIKKVVDKYNGVFETKYEQGYFILVVMLMDV